MERKDLITDSLALTALDESMEGRKEWAAGRVLQLLGED
jgi:hypothetical protein